MELTPELMEKVKERFLKAQAEGKIFVATLHWNLDLGDRKIGEIPPDEFPSMKRWIEFGEEDANEVRS